MISKSNEKIHIKDVPKKIAAGQVLQTEQITRIKVPRSYIVALWIIALITLGSMAFGAYSYVSMPNRVAKYVSQHKSELKGEKGDTGDTGDMGPSGINGTDGSSGNSGSLHCTTYGINNQYTDCY